jgi:hypothetical protein
METLLILYTGNTIDLHLCQEDLPHIEFPPISLAAVPGDFFFAQNFADNSDINYFSHQI